ncbi:MAG: Tn3 family transposase, partial [Pseudonocardiaceae bacterium]
MGFRECGVADADKLTEWLVTNVTQAERRGEQVREELLTRLLAERIEPPTAGRIDRIVRSALHRGEELLVAWVVGRLPSVVRARLRELVSFDGGEELGETDGSAELASIRSEPGNVSLNTMLAEVAKLETVRAVGLPADLFVDVAPRVLAGWRARVAVEAPSHLRMVDGVIRHGTDMAVEANYVDSHGQSEIGFGVTKLLGFDL